MAGLDIVINKVWKRLTNVLVLITKGNESNDLVETKRGKQFQNLDLDEVFLLDDADAAEPAAAEPATPHMDLVVDDEDSGID